MKGHRNKYRGKKLPWIGHSKPHTKEAKKKMSLAKMGKRGKESNKFGKFKTDAKYKYGSIHTWMNYHFGKPMKCEHCKNTDKKRYDWANISGKYLRIKEDWYRLCRSCHIKYDHGTL